MLREPQLRPTGREATALGRLGRPDAAMLVAALGRGQPAEIAVVAAGVDRITAAMRILRALPQAADKGAACRPGVYHPWIELRSSARLAEPSS
jgi:hypothetical protein